MFLLVELYISESGESRHSLPRFGYQRAGTLGTTARGLRRNKGFTQEDMLSFVFSTRHRQQVEAGRPIIVTTLLRICEVFEMPMSKLEQGLDTEGIYGKLEPRFRHAGEAD